MTVKINTAYPFFYSAIPMLADRGIELNIIKSNSPYVLATVGGPDIVIHPLSKVMNGEFPEIKFVGPDCKFPNFDFTPEICYTDWNLNKIKGISSGAYRVFINTVNDTAFIKYLESFCNLGSSLAIFGKPCDSLYYYGELEVDSYALYKGHLFAAVDNQAELLKASRVKKDVSLSIVSNFNNDMCTWFKDEYNTCDNKPLPEVLKNKNWNEVFKNLFKELGMQYG